MKIASVKISRRSGSTLVESSIAMGVLALAVPLVFGSMAEAGKSGASAEAETRSAWIIPACIQEIENSRAGKPQYFTATETGQTFPPENEIWALAFSNEGSTVNKITIAQYDSGIKNLDGKAISHLAKISATKAAENDDMLDLRISLEYPATAPAGKRRTLDFHSRIP
jgi:type II secretory pathway pseudopilin PulG